MGLVSHPRELDTQRSRSVPSQLIETQQWLADRRCPASPYATDRVLHVSATAGGGSESGDEQVHPTECEETRIRSRASISGQDGLVTAYVPFPAANRGPFGGDVVAASMR